MSSSNDENKKIDNIGEFFTGQASQGWLDLKRKFLHNSNKISWGEGKEHTQKLLDEVTKKQLDKQQLLDDYANSKGLVGGTLVNLAGGLFRNANDMTSVFINATTGPLGPGVNILSNVAEYAWDEASLYDRNIITEWDNEKDIINLIPGAVFGMASGMKNIKTPGELLKPEDNFGKIKKPREKKKIKVDIQELNLALDEANVPPLEKIIEKNKHINPDILEQNLKNGNGVIHIQDFAEVIKRKEWGQPQGNYENTVQSELQNYLEYATDLDKKYKHEKGKTTIFQGKDVIRKGRSSIQIESELDIAIQPLYKNTILHLNQIASKDAQELFGETKLYKPFGNMLFDLSESFSKKDFAEMIQGKIDITGEDGSQQVQNVLRKKVNEYIGVKSGLDTTPNIERAFYTDLLYNKQETMTYVHNLIIDKNFDEIKSNLGSFVGKKVELSQSEVDGIIHSMIEMGKRNGVELTSQITKAGTYSIDDYPLEMATGFWHAINSTTKDALKDTGTYSAKNKWDVGRQWGNLADEISPDLDLDKVKFGNYAKIFEGFERAPYEVLTDVYNTVAKSQVGLDELQLFFEDISVDKSKLKITDDIYGNRVKGLDSNIRKNMKQQIDSLIKVVESENRYKPNFNVDPENPILTSQHARKMFKNFLNYKFLYGLNYIKEMPLNASMVNRGARSLGWEMGNLRFNKDIFIESTKMHYDLFKNWDNIKQKNLSGITDPKVKRRLEIFLEKRVANDTIMNDPSKLMKGAQGTANFMGELGGFGQGLSDVHRVFTAEWGATNYMLDILPNKEIKSHRLNSVLKSNGIDGNLLTDIKSRLANISENDFYELVWSGKRADNDIDIKIQNIYEQFSDIMGRKFNPFEKIEAPGKDGFVNDMLLLYKRYSLGAVNNSVNFLLNYYGDDGVLRKRFDLNDSITENAKRTFKGVNHNQLITLGQVGLYSYILKNGVQWATGKLYGTGQDFKVEAKLEAITEGGDALPFLWESTQELFFTLSGTDILFGASTPFGGLIQSIADRSNRANSSIYNEPYENWLWFANTILTPEHIARGIDNIKFKKSIPSRLNSASDEADFLWRVKYKNLAKIQQLEGQLPVESVLQEAVDWASYFSDNITKAYEITGAPKETPKETVVIGATAMVELLEDKSEKERIIEVMSEENSLAYKEAELKRTGLDIDTMLHQLDKKEVKTLNIILAYNQTFEAEEVLLIVQGLVKAKDKQIYLKNLIPPQELDYYRSYAKQISRAQEPITELIKSRTGDSNIERYINTIKIADDFIRR